MREKNIFKIKSYKQMFSVIAVFTLILLVGGVSIAFFNYTRTGGANTVSVGRISFTSSQETVTFNNVFPIDSTEAATDTTNAKTISVTVTGDTDYANGLEYLITADDVNLSVNNKQLPISLEVSVANNSNLGTEETGDYYTNRENYSVSKYKVEYNGKLQNDSHILVGYIAPNTTLGTANGTTGTINIKAYIDKDRILISDTYPEGEVTINNQTYYNGTTNPDNKVVFTTSEWNSITGNNSFSFKIKVEANEGIWVEDTRGFVKVQKAINEKINATTNSCNPIWVDDNGTANDESDDITYFSGTNACVDMNYVWYSGKLWRITAIYPDGSMKMITENMITSIAFNESGQVNFWTDANTTSYMYQWLNEDFYDTLYHASEFIDTSKRWNATADTNISTKPGNTNLVTANVGLLNSYEYYNSYRCISSAACTGSSYSTGYLNIKYYWRLLNPYDASFVWRAFDDGRAGGIYPTEAYGGRPSIVIKSGLEFTGSGTSDNPYKIVGDKDTGSTNDLINTRLSGEYVKLKNGSNEQTFRIIGVENNKTKIIAMDYADNKGTRKFATSSGSANTLWGSGTTTGTDTWYDYLNNTYLSNLRTTYGELFDGGTYYLGTTGYNYKLSVCANTTNGSTKNCIETNQLGTHDTFNIGLPRYGEMFATQQSGGYSNSITMWLMNRFSASTVWYVNGRHYAGNYYPTSTYGGRPTLHLKSTVKILSGSGTETDPYVVGL